MNEIDQAPVPSPEVPAGAAQPPYPLLQRALALILNLPIDASEADILGTIRTLKQRADVISEARAQESAIRNIMAESHGALSYENAKVVLETRDRYASKLPKTPQ